MTNIATHLGLKYLQFAERASVEELDLANQNLEGELDFTHLGFTNLKKLNLANNRLTKLVLLNPNQIDFLDISNNKIVDLIINDELVENRTKNMARFEFLNNPLPEEFQKTLLKTRWDYWKDVEKHYPDLLSPQILKTVDISDLDNFIANYDFSKQGEPKYHQILGGNYAQLDERGLQQLAQQILARCLIAQNQLVSGPDENYELEINNFARQFQKSYSMYLQYPLSLIQRELSRRLRGSKDLEKEFQDKLFELENLLEPTQTPNLERAVDLSAIKEKIKDLQDTVNEQQSEIVQLKSLLKDKETVRRTLEEKYRQSEQKADKLGENCADIQKTNQELQNKLDNLGQELEQKIETLTLAEENEQTCRQRITELEEEISTNSTTLRSEFDTLLSQKDSYITQLERLLKDIKKSKKAVEESLTESNKKLIKEQKSPNYWKWGGITMIILVVLGLGYWGWKKIRN